MISNQTLIEDEEREKLVQAKVKKLVQATRIVQFPSSTLPATMIVTKNYIRTTHPILK